MMNDDAEAEPGELFRALFEEAAEAILVVDAAGRIVRVNKAAEALLGHTTRALVGQAVESLVPVRFGQHGRQRTGFSEETRPRPMGRGLQLFARGADGGDIPVDISLAPIVVAGNRLTACSMRDLRGRAHAADTLRVQATALRSAANGIVITDRAGTITWVNAAACAITGYASDELVGQHTRILKSGRHPRDFYEGLWQTVLRGETWSGTIVNRRKDGSAYHEEQTIAPVVDDEGVVTHFIAIKQDVSEQRRIQEALGRAHQDLAARLMEIEALNLRLREQATIDPLTQLHNRRHLDETIGRVMARAIRSGEPVVIALLDVDHFKHINDSKGHATGDRVLRRLADLLRAQVRASDLVCRVGGDEFVVVMPGTSLQVARPRAEEWRATFAEAEVPAEDGAVVRCTATIGLALQLDPAEPFAVTLSRADAALYAAKRGGRNRVRGTEEPPEA